VGNFGRGYTDAYIDDSTIYVIDVAKSIDAKKQVFLAVEQQPSHG
jgi:hypothetical protein